MVESYDNGLPMNAPTIPKAFIWRRLHSLAGLWLVLYLIDHLLINSQAALLVGDDGRGFIHSVNAIHDLPYLPVLEILILGVPIAIHAIWGIQYLLTGQMNSFPGNGSKPALPEYSRNWAYSFQRITSWLLILGLLGHVAQMRFMNYPVSGFLGTQKYYIIRITNDEGLTTLSERLEVTLFSSQEIQELVAGEPHGKAEGNSPLMGQHEKQRLDWLKALQKKPLTEGQVIAVAKDFGTAELLMLRDTFKVPYMMVLYTLFVLAACYHAFNGLWTSFITWGILLTQTSQRMMLKLSQGLMLVVTFLGLAAIWMTYWINLKS